MKCISCEKKPEQDFGGWETLRPESDMVLCPTCILNFDLVKDIIKGSDNLMEEQANIYKALQVLQTFLNNPKG